MQFWELDRRGMLIRLICSQLDLDASLLCWDWHSDLELSLLADRLCAV